MKIGIMTFWWSEDNYGQLLQCYALQKYLRDQGHDPFLIRYDPRNDYVPTPLYRKLLKALNPVKLAGFLASKRKKYLAEKEYIVHNRQFSIFRDTYLKQSEQIYYSYDELKANPPQADCYIVGSDQVWNFGSVINKSYLHSYLLDFGNNKIKRLAYAASFGSTEIGKIASAEIIELLKRFDMVSLREQSGVQQCDDLGINSVLVCDPTLLLGQNDWDKLEANCIKHTQKYIFVYMLENTCNFSLKKLAEWAAKYKLEIIYVSGNRGYKKVNFSDSQQKKSYLTISEWIYYLKHAEYVITNSFHCCVFSLIYHKKSGVVLLAGTLQKSNDRIISLFRNLKVGLTQIKNNDFNLLLSNTVPVVDTEFIEMSKRLLLSALKN